MITTVDEVNSDKTKVLEEFIFRGVLQIVLLPNSMFKLIHNQYKLLVTEDYIDAYVYANEQLGPCFMF